MAEKSTSIFRSKAANIAMSSTMYYLACLGGGSASAYKAYEAADKYPNRDANPYYMATFFGFMGLNLTGVVLAFVSAPFRRDERIPRVPDTSEELISEIDRRCENE